MIVYNLNFVGVIPNPLEGDSPLVVDSNTPKVLKTAFQFFQFIPWGYSKIVNVLRVIDHSQFPSGNGLNVLWKLL